MAEMRYYKRPFVNTNQPRLDNGTQLDFKSVDGVNGWFATDAEEIQAEFARWAREKRGGVVEVSAEEFSVEYVQKKTQGVVALPKPWREQIGSGLRIEGHRLAPAVQPDASVAAAAESPATVIPIPTVPGVTIEGAKAQFNPPVGKRRTKPKA